MGNYNDYLEYLKHIDNTTEQEIKAKVDGLNDEITNLKNNVANLTKVKDGLTTDLANANREINGKIDIINVKETELKKVETDLKQTKKELKETQNKLLELEKSYSLSQEKNTSLSNEISELQKKQSTLKSESKTYQKDLKDTNFKLTELEKLYANEQSNNASLNNQISELKSKYSVLETDFKSKNSNVESYIAEIQKLHLELETAKNDFKNAKSNSSDVNEQVAKYKQEIERLNKIVNSNGSNSQDFVNEIGKLYLEINQLKSSLSETNKLKNSIESKLKELQSKNFETTIQQLKSEKAAIENILNSTKSKLTELQKKFNDISKEQNEDKTKIQLLINQVPTLILTFAILYFLLTPLLEYFEVRNLSFFGFEHLENGEIHLATYFLKGFAYLCKISILLSLTFLIAKFVRTNISNKKKKTKIIYVTIANILFVSIFAIAHLNFDWRYNPLINHYLNSFLLFGAKSDYYYFIGYEVIIFANIFHSIIITLFFYTLYIITKRITQSIIK